MKFVFEVIGKKMGPSNLADESPDDAKRRWFLVCCETPTVFHHELVATLAKEAKLAQGFAYKQWLPPHYFYAVAVKLSLDFALQLVSLLVAHGVLYSS